MNYLYLHGFASGPRSIKAIALRNRFAKQGIQLIVPDLNQPDFFNLTLTRQLQQCEALLAAQSGAWTILGSSLGGLTAAWLGQRNVAVERLVLLAPAFKFLSHWQQQLGAAKLEQWQKDGAVEVYHHTEERPIPLSYAFWQDVSQYAEAELNGSAAATLILHGINDEVIPVEVSRHYAAKHPQCTLIELPSDHGLTDVLPEIWAATQQFCGLASAQTD
jgi:pimeloyl-ACP methyl ester carboxylesterase